mgnify:CR=1 FL=1
MVDFKTMNLKVLGNVVILAILLIVAIAVIMVFVGPILTTVLPGVFAGGIGLTDTLLLLILLRLFIK